MASNDETNKIKYSEVRTPQWLIQEHVENILNFHFKTIETNWKNNTNYTFNILDVGTADYSYIYVLLEKYIQRLKSEFVSRLQNKSLKNISIQLCCVGIEKNPTFEQLLETKIQESPYHNHVFAIDKSRNIQCNIKCCYIIQDFCLWDTTDTFDIVLGNIPFNNDGIMKTPCHKNLDKKLDGKSVWRNIILKSLEILKNQDSILSFVSPNSWLKPDRFRIYDTLINKHKVLYIKSFDSAQCNKIFQYKAQLPFCYFVLKNCLPQRETKSKFTQIYQNIQIYDSLLDEVIDFCLLHNYPIPTHNLRHIQNLVDKYVADTMTPLSLYVDKTNCVNKNKTKLFNERQNEKYTQNIASSIYHRLNDNLELKIEYSNIPCPYYGIPKIIGCHKRLPLFIRDDSGKYGISRRDNYIIPYSNFNNIDKIFTLLQMDDVKKTLKSFQYRMNYLEKYGFEYIFIPNIWIVSV